MWYCPLGSVISFVVGWISSWMSNLVLREEAKELDLDLMTPVVASIVRKGRLRRTRESRNGVVVLDKIS